MELYMKGPQEGSNSRFELAEEKEVKFRTDQHRLPSWNDIFKRK